MLVNKDILNLIESVNPFMGEKGKNITSLAKHFLEMLDSEAGHKTLDTFLSFKPLKKVEKKETLIKDDSIENKKTNVFSKNTSTLPIFLILILLIGLFNKK